MRARGSALRAGCSRRVYVSRSGSGVAPTNDSPAVNGTGGAGQALRLAAAHDIDELNVRAPQQAFAHVRDPP
jgi:hypothetical protein